MVTSPPTRQAKSPESRATSFLSRFQCGPVCREIGHDGEPAFKVEAVPVPRNDAHAHILSAISRGEGGLRKLRNLLLPYLQRLIAFDEYAKHGPVER